tara:strand:- start:1849 stop:2943 length:1095 start_codon:yes stop_codon:yes gene_type:complete
MATFETQVEGLTQISITDSSAPTQNELTEYLNDGIKDLTNKVTHMKPDEMYKFCSESTLSDGDGIKIKGKVLSVVRENSSTSDLRPATPISAAARYLATDTDSLHYRSKFNPAFYLLNRKLYVIPVPDTTDNNSAYISHLDYKTTSYTEHTVVDFPEEYHDLLVLYASAFCCLAACSDIQNNMPEKPTAPSSPQFDYDSDVELPNIPVYAPPQLNLNYNMIKQRLSVEDFDSADHYMTLIEKEIEEYEKAQDIEKESYSKELELFKTELSNMEKNIDREFQIMAGEYRSEIFKYQYDIDNYNAELQESFTKYKWYFEQYTYFMNEYNKGIMFLASPTKTKRAEAPKQPTKARAKDPESIQESEE